MKSITFNFENLCNLLTGSCMCISTSFPQHPVNLCQRDGEGQLKLGSGRSGGPVCSRTAKTTTGPVGWYSSCEKYRKFAACVSFPSTSILWIFFGKIFLTSEKNSQIFSIFIQFLPAAHFFLIIFHPPRFKFLKNIPQLIALPATITIAAKSPKFNPRENFKRKNHQKKPKIV